MNLDQALDFLKVDAERFDELLTQTGLELQDSYGESDIQKLQSALTQNQALPSSAPEADKPVATTCSLEDKPEGGAGYLQRRKTAEQNIPASRKGAAKSRAKLAKQVQEKMIQDSKEVLTFEEQAANALAMVIDPDMSYARIQARAVALVSEAQTCSTVNVEASFVEDDEINPEVDFDIIYELMEVKTLAITGV